MTSISRKDLEALSAYLDQAQTPRERARLEARLERESGLRAELESLRRTRQLLRGAPRVRAPRNFTLTPETAAASRPERRLFPAARLAFALASMVFVFALAGNYTFNIALAPPAERATAYTAADEPAAGGEDIAAAPAAPEAAEEEGLAEQAVEAEPSPTPEAEMEVAPAAEPETDAAAAPTEPAPSGAGPGEGPGEGPDRSGGDAVEAPPPATSVEEVPALAPPTEEAMGVVGEGAADDGSGDAAGGEAAAPEATATKTATKEIPPAPAEDREPGSLGFWRWAIVLSGALALLSGGIMLLARRRF